MELVYPLPETLLEAGSGACVLLLLRNGCAKRAHVYSGTLLTSSQIAHDAGQMASSEPARNSRKCNPDERLEAYRMARFISSEVRRSAWAKC